MRFILLLAVVHGGLIFAFAQIRPPEHWLHGIVKTPKDEVVAGVTLHLSGTETSYKSSDINGEFVIRLKPGEYDLSVERYNIPNYRLHLKIFEGPVNPDNLLITVDPEKFCCMNASSPMPKPIAIPKAIYPAAARAVRATGDIFVEVQIDKDGKVQSAKAIGGHPLLQRVSEIAAKNATFEARYSPEIRIAVIDYVFLSRVTPKPELRRYTNPFRIEITNDSEVIQTISVDPGNRTSFLFRLKKFFRFL